MYSKETGDGFVKVSKKRRIEDISGGKNSAEVIFALLISSHLHR